jgi:hypothetical protein
MKNKKVETKIGLTINAWFTSGKWMEALHEEQCSLFYHLNVIIIITFLYIMELSNKIHFEVIDFNMYIMQLIGMKNS